MKCAWETINVSKVLPVEGFGKSEFKNATTVNLQSCI
jgi:hypothetical protein